MLGDTEMRIEGEVVVEFEISDRLRRAFLSRVILLSLVKNDILILCLPFHLTQAILCLFPTE
jgi:hypothetical protein